MSSENQKVESQTIDGTLIDLGEDLLEKTAILPSLSQTPDSTSESIPSETLSLAELLENAKILAREGLIEDAKKALHEVIRRDPQHSEAIRILEELRSQELKKIFNTEESLSRYERQQLPPAETVDSKAILNQLEQDLNLGIFSEAAKAAEKLREQEDQILAELRSQLFTGTPQDWIDMGVGFLEMELYSLSTRLFSEACRWGGQSAAIDESEEGKLNRKSATALLALSLLLEGRPFDAISKIQPFLHDSDLKKEEKLEFIYLMGRIYEVLRKPKQAADYYREVLRTNPGYRDVAWRLRK